MRLGINLTSPVHSAVPLALLRGGRVDYCEILIDNFLHLSPATLREAVGDVPLAFHIMNSRFLEQDDEALVPLAARLRELIAEVKPLYVSDHLGYFSHRGRRLPLVLELDYARDFAHTAARVARWQDLLGAQVNVENFPSTFPTGQAQVEFYERLVQATGCGVLFDVSNALVAELNGVLPADTWLPLAAQMVHFHVAGYLPEDSEPPVVIDSHDTAVSPETWAFAGRLRRAQGTRAPLTLTVERDGNIEEAAWLVDIEAARHAFA